MTIERLKTLALIVLSSFLLWGYVNEKDTERPAKTDKNVEVTETIRLYSNGKLIGEWEGIGRGKMSGNTYTFKTERGSFSDEIRISGDFVVKTDTN
jgi:hypothetical protein